MTLSCSCFFYFPLSLSLGGRVGSVDAKGLSASALISIDFFLFFQFFCIIAFAYPFFLFVCMSAYLSCFCITVSFHPSVPLYTFTLVSSLFLPPLLIYFFPYYEYLFSMFNSSTSFYLQFLFVFVFVFFFSLLVLSLIFYFSDKFYSLGCAIAQTRLTY